MSSTEAGTEPVLLVKVGQVPPKLLAVGDEFEVEAFTGIIIFCLYLGARCDFVSAPPFGTAPCGR